jgi:hypothetical protein
VAFPQQTAFVTIDARKYVRQRLRINPWLSYRSVTDPGRQANGRLALPGLQDFVSVEKRLCSGAAVFAKECLGMECDHLASNGVQTLPGPLDPPPPAAQPPHGAQDQTLPPSLSVLLGMEAETPICPPIGRFADEDQPLLPARGPVSRQRLILEWCAGLIILAALAMTGFALPFL